MTKQDFESKMALARAMHGLSDRPYYYEGCMRGLRRTYHGKTFGTDGQHQQWFSLTEDVDETRREKGRGYRDGLQGKSPTVT
jgi:hypothetical protein